MVPMQYKNLATKLFFKIIKHLDLHNHTKHIFCTLIFTNLIHTSIAHTLCKIDPFIQIAS